MKKLCTILSIICMCFLAFACGKQPSISCDLTKLTVNMDSTITIDSSKIHINNSKSGYQLEIEDSDIAIIEGMKITPKSAGQTKIIISLIKDKSVNCSIDLVVTNITYAEDIAIDHEELQLNLRVLPTIINKISVNDGCNEIPEVVYTPAGIVDYNYTTGKVTAIKPGIATVVAYYRNCNVGFRVEVTDVVYTTTMSVRDNVVVQGTKGIINFDCYPNMANTFKFYTDSDIITIDELGHYEAHSLGSADVFYQYITSKDATPIEGAFKVYVIEPITSFNAFLLDENYNNPSYYLIEKTYKLVVDLDKNISPKSIILSSNISFADWTHFVYKEGYGWVANIIFNKYKDNEIIVTYQYGEAEQNCLKQSIFAYVHGFKDFKVMAKCNGATLSRGGDSASYYYDREINNNNPISFYWQLGDQQIDYDIEVYYMEGNNKVYLVGGQYAPTSDSEITLHCELDGVLKETITIYMQ